MADDKTDFGLADAEPDDNVAKLYARQWADDEFTPTTEQVRDAFIMGSDEDGAGVDFDRWLALHDDAVRRVTPDREKFIDFAEEWYDRNAGPGETWTLGDLYDAAAEAGVLGVPADQTGTTCEISGTEDAKT